MMGSYYLSKPFYCPSLINYKSQYKKVSVIPIWIVKSNISSIGPSSERNMTSTLETLVNK